MKKGERITGVLLLIASAYIINTALGYGLMSRNQPGPGFMAFWAGLLLAILSMLLIANTFRGKYKDKGEVFNKDSLKYAVIFIGISLLVSLLMRFVGMVIGVGILSALIHHFLADDKSIKKTLLIGVSVTAAIYIIFIFVLDVYLLRGVFGF